MQSQDRKASVSRAVNSILIDTLERTPTSSMPTKTKLADVSFYYLDSDELRIKHLTACRLATQAFEQAKSTFILTVDDRESQQIDELLWVFPPNRFIPHSRGEGSKNGALIQIHNELPNDPHFLLINLTSEAPPIAGKIKRIFEIVRKSEATAAIRRRQHYEDIQCEIAGVNNLTTAQIQGSFGRESA